MIVIGNWEDDLDTERVDSVLRASTAEREQSEAEHDATESHDTDRPATLDTSTEPRRHGHTSTRNRPPGEPKDRYVREDHLLVEVAATMTKLAMACPALSSEGCADDLARVPARQGNIVIIYTQEGAVVTADRA
ncbi:hypothetical protein INP57_24075 [Saccharopolyspora sp. HNM0986]|uniref:hypothetical protein n=1 Tax=Saccharopolyspora galaxeae TaxID=2781241 RepID=UPI00190C0BEC|nr:hypothetical protein [Saccharopolyspora sp. HNM0986]MBK0869896.1 hypothetical protein [Saccharopolyspora sp. HNM0986]